MKRIYSIIVVSLLLASLGIYNYIDGRKSETMLSNGGVSLEDFKPKAGQLSPAQELPDFNEQMISFGSAQPKLQLINFWASWCGPCELEAPDLQKIHEKYSDSLVLYGVNATKDDRERQARQFVEDQGFTFDILFDREGDITNLYKVGTFPTSFLVDRDGVIRERINGVITLEQWERIIEQYM